MAIFAKDEFANIDTSSDEKFSCKRPNIKAQYPALYDIWCSIDGLKLKGFTINEKMISMLCAL